MGVLDDVEEYNATVPESLQMRSQPKEKPEKPKRKTNEQQIAEIDKYMEDYGIAKAVPSDSFVTNLGRDIVGGAVDAYEMGGRALRALPGGSEAGNFDGSDADSGISDDIINSAEQFKNDNPQYGNVRHKGFSRWIHDGIRSTVTSVLAGATGMIGGAIAGGAEGGIPGAVVGFATGAGTTFGLADYDSEMEAAHKANISEEVAAPAAFKHGLAEGGFEFLGDMLMGYANGVLKPLTAPAKAALRDGVVTALKTSLKARAKGYVISAVGETSSEMATSYVQTKIDNRIGLSEENAMTQASRAFGPAFVSSLLFSTSAHLGSSINERQKSKVLMSAEADPNARIAIATEVGNRLAEFDNRAAKMWMQHSIAAIQDKAPISPETNYENMTERLDKLQSNAEKGVEGAQAKLDLITDFMEGNKLTVDDLMNNPDLAWTNAKDRAAQAAEVQGEIQKADAERNLRNQTAGEQATRNDTPAARKANVDTSLQAEMQQQFGEDGDIPDFSGTPTPKTQDEIEAENELEVQKQAADAEAARLKKIANDDKITKEQDALKAAEALKKKEEGSTPAQTTDTVEPSNQDTIVEPESNTDVPEGTDEGKTGEKLTYDESQTLIHYGVKPGTEKANTLLAWMRKSVAEGGVEGNITQDELQILIHYGAKPDTEEADTILAKIRKGKAKSEANKKVSENVSENETDSLSTEETITPVETPVVSSDAKPIETPEPTPTTEANKVVFNNGERSRAVIAEIPTLGKVKGRHVTKGENEYFIRKDDAGKWHAHDITTGEVVATGKTQKEVAAKLSEEVKITEEATTPAEGTVTPVKENIEPQQPKVQPEVDEGTKPTNETPATAKTTPYKIGEKDTSGSRSVKIDNISGFEVVPTGTGKFNLYHDNSDEPFSSGKTAEEAVQNYVKQNNSNDARQDAFIQRTVSANIVKATDSMSNAEIDTATAKATIKLNDAGIKIPDYLVNHSKRNVAKVLQQLAEDINNETFSFSDTGSNKPINEAYKNPENLKLQEGEEQIAYVPDEGEEYTGSDSPSEERQTTEDTKPSTKPETQNESKPKEDKPKQEAKPKEKPKVGISDRMLETKIHEEFGNAFENIKDKVVFVRNDEDFPGKASKTAKGAYGSNGKIYLFPARMQKDESLGVFIHEGLHKAVSSDKNISKHTKAAVATFARLNGKNAGVTKAFEIAKKARRGNNSTELLNEEAAAFYLQSLPYSAFKSGPLASLAMKVKMALSKVGLAKPSPKHLSMLMQDLILQDMKKAGNKHGKSSIIKFSDIGSINNHLSPAAINREELRAKIKAGKLNVVHIIGTTVTGRGESHAGILSYLDDKNTIQIPTKVDASIPMPFDTVVTELKSAILKANNNPDTVYQITSDESGTFGGWTANSLVPVLIDAPSNLVFPKHWEASVPVNPFAKGNALSHLVTKDRTAKQLLQQWMTTREFDVPISWHEDNDIAKAYRKIRPQEINLARVPKIHFEKAEFTAKMSKEEREDHIEAYNDFLRGEVFTETYNIFNLDSRSKAETSDIKAKLGTILGLNQQMEEGNLDLEEQLKAKHLITQTITRLNNAYLIEHKGNNNGFLVGKVHQIYSEAPSSTDYSTADEELRRAKYKYKSFIKHVRNAVWFKNNKQTFEEYIPDEGEEIIEDEQTEKFKNAESEKLISLKSEQAVSKEHGDVVTSDGKNQYPYNPALTVSAEELIHVDTAPNSLVEADSAIQAIMDEANSLSEITSEMSDAIIAITGDKGGAYDWKDTVYRDKTDESKLALKNAAEEAKLEGHVFAETEEAEAALRERNANKSSANNVSGKSIGISFQSLNRLAEMLGIKAETYYDKVKLAEDVAAGKHNQVIVDQFIEEQLGFAEVEYAGEFTDNAIVDGTINYNTPNEESFTNRDRVNRSNVTREAVSVVDNRGESNLTNMNRWVLDQTQTRDDQVSFYTSQIVARLGREPTEFERKLIDKYSEAKAFMSDFNFMRNIYGALKLTHLNKKFFGDDTKGSRSYEDRSTIPTEFDKYEVVQAKLPEGQIVGLSTDGKTAYIDPMQLKIYYRDKGYIRDGEIQSDGSTFTSSAKFKIHSLNDAAKFLIAREKALLDKSKYPMALTEAQIEIAIENIASSSIVHSQADMLVHELLTLIPHGVPVKAAFNYLKKEATVPVGQWTTIPEELMELTSLARELQARDASIMAANGKMVNADQYIEREVAANKNTAEMVRFTTEINRIGKDILHYDGVRAFVSDKTQLAKLVDELVNDSPFADDAMMKRAVAAKLASVIVSAKIVDMNIDTGEVSTTKVPTLKMPEPPTLDEIIEAVNNQRALSVSFGTDANVDLSTSEEHSLVTTYNNGKATTELRFHSAEQAFLYHKAKTAGKDQLATRILGATDGAELNKIIDSNNFNMTNEQKDKWASQNGLIMTRLVREFFEQNSEAAQKLIATREHRLVSSRGDEEWQQHFPSIMEEVREKLRASASRDAKAKTEAEQAQIGLSEIDSFVQSLSDDNRNEIAQATPAIVNAGDSIQYAKKTLAAEVERALGISSELKLKEKVAAVAAKMQNTKGLDEELVAKMDWYLQNVSSSGFKVTPEDVVDYLNRQRRMGYGSGIQKISATGRESKIFKIFDRNALIAISHLFKTYGEDMNKVVQAVFNHSSIAPNNPGVSIAAKINPDPIAFGERARGIEIDSVDASEALQDKVKEEHFGAAFNGKDFVTYDGEFQSKFPKGGGITAHEDGSASFAGYIFNDVSEKMITRAVYGIAGNETNDLLVRAIDGRFNGYSSSENSIQKKAKDDLYADEFGKSPNVITNTVHGKHPEEGFIKWKTTAYQSFFKKIVEARKNIDKTTVARFKNETDEHFNQRIEDKKTWIYKNYNNMLTGLRNELMKNNVQNGLNHSKLVSQGIPESLNYDERGGKITMSIPFQDSTSNSVVETKLTTEANKDDLFIEEVGNELFGAEDYSAYRTNDGYHISVSALEDREPQNEVYALATVLAAQAVNKKSVVKGLREKPALVSSLYKGLRGGSQLVNIINSMKRNGQVNSSNVQAITDAAEALFDAHDQLMNIRKTDSKQTIRRADVALGQAKLYKQFADLIDTNKMDVSAITKESLNSFLYEKIKYSDIAEASLDELKGYLKGGNVALKDGLHKVFPRGSKGYKSIVKLIERAVDGLFNFTTKHITKHIYADLGADKKSKNLALKVITGHEQEMARLGEAMRSKGYSELFQAMPRAEQEALFDRITLGVSKAGNGKSHPLDFTKEKDVKIALDEGISQEVINAYTFFKAESDKLSERLKKHYPAFEYLATHYGQVIPWQKKNGAPTIYDVDNIIFPEGSRLAGERSFKDSRTSDMTVAQRAKVFGVNPQTVNPAKMFMNYAKNANIILNVKDMISQAIAEDRAKIAIGNEVITNGMIPIDDAAFNLAFNETPDRLRVVVNGDYAKSQGGQVLVFGTKSSAAEWVHAYARNSEVSYEPVVGEVERVVVGYQIKPVGASFTDEPIKVFANYKDAMKFAKGYEEQHGENIITVEPKFASAKVNEWVGRVFFEPTLAKMLNTFVGKDHFKEASIAGISGKQLLNAKNQLTAIEFAAGLFHATVISNEVTANQMAHKFLTSKGMDKVKALNPFSALKTGIKDSHKIEALVAGMLTNPDIVNAKGFKELAKDALGVSDVNMLDAMNMYFHVGGKYKSQDPSLRSDVHSLGVMKYGSGKLEVAIKNGKAVLIDSRVKGIGSVGDIAKNMNASIAKTFNDELKRTSKPIRSMVDASRFTVMEATTNWLMEKTIPAAKMAAFFKEYGRRLNSQSQQVANGEKTKVEIADDVMKFVEDRMGEVNWEVQFMNKSVKSGLQFAFRSFPWFTGNVKALSKASFDVTKYGFYKVQGKDVKLTEKGMWAFSALVAHATASALIWTAYGALAGGGDDEVPDDKNIPLAYRMMFPRVDPHNPSNRVAIASYMSEGAKLLNHLGITGSQFEPLEIIKHRFSSILSNAVDVWDGYDWQGVSVRNSHDNFAVQATDSIMHLLNVAPISISSAYQQYNSGNLTPTTAILSALGMTSAPSFARRSTATQDALRLSREEYKGKTISKSDLSKREKISHATSALVSGDRSELQGLLRSGEISQNDFKKAVQRASTIGGKKNSKHIDMLTRTVKRLSLKNTLKTWDEMTNDEKRVQRSGIIKKYNNAKKSKSKSRNEKTKLRQMMVDKGLL